jgi:hypothetical protein
MRFPKNEKATPTDALIDSVLEEMHDKGVDSEEYPKLMTYLERLHEVKAKSRRSPVSRDTLALVLGNLAGILIIVAYEQKHIMSTKGYNHIIRPRAEQISNK